LDFFNDFFYGFSGATYFCFSNLFFMERTKQKRS